jgi:hypothetical protein
MWRWGVSMGSALALFLGATALGDARTHRKPPPNCPREGSHTITADGQAQVFLSAESTGLSGPYEQRQVFGCTYANGRSYRLGWPPYSDPGGTGGVEQETIAGSMVAYTESTSDGVGSDASSGGTWVYVRNLRNGRLLHRLLSGVQLQPHPPGYSKGVGPVRSVVLKSDGAVAWIAYDFLRTIAGGSPYRSYFDLYAAEASGERLVAAGTEINPFSLALAGSTLYWTEGGKPMSEPLS